MYGGKLHLCSAWSRCKLGNRQLLVHCSQGLFSWEAHYSWNKKIDENWAAIWQNQQKMRVRPVKTQISLGICSVWSGSLLSAWRKLGSLATHWAHSEDWSDWVDARANLSLLGACSFCWFCHVTAQMLKQILQYISYNSIHNNEL